VLEGFVDPRGTTAAGLEPGRTWLVVVELEDEEGRTGAGTAGFGNPATVELLRQLEPLVMGSAPSEVARVWESMYRATLNIGRRGVVLHAVSAVDIALWDLFGKQLGVPVYELLGGKLRHSLRRTRAGSTRRRTSMPSQRRRLAGSSRDSTPSSSGFRTARSRGRRGSAGTSSSFTRSSRRWARTSTSWPTRT
jgi:L-alanine-DL-glutamate epimerase-like enolase superfamily enzyme